MQIGIDVGATKIESVVLENDGQEKHRSRIPCPKDYTQIITAIRDIHRKIEQEFTRTSNWSLSSRSSFSSNWISKKCSKYILVRKKAVSK